MVVNSLFLGSVLFDLAYDAGFNLFEILFFRGFIALLGGLLYDVGSRYLEYKNIVGNKMMDDTADIIINDDTSDGENSPLNLANRDTHMSWSVGGITDDNNNNNHDDEPVGGDETPFLIAGANINSGDARANDDNRSVAGVARSKSKKDWWSSVYIVYTVRLVTDWNEYYPSNLWLLFRGTLRIVATLLFYLSLEWIYLGTSVTLYDTVPVWSLFLDRFMFGRQLTLSHYLVTLVVVCGMVLVVQPSFIFDTGAGDGNTHSTVYTVAGYICPIASGIFEAFTIATMQQFTNCEKERNIDISDTSIIFAGMYSVSIQYAVFGIIGSFMLYGEFLYPTCANVGAIGIAYALGIGLFNLFALITVNFSVTRLTTSEISLLLLLEVIWAYLFELVLYNESPDLIEIIGVILIILPMCCFFGYNIYIERGNMSN